MQNNKLSAISIILLISIAGNSNAESITTDKISEVQNETFLLKAQVEQEELRLKLKKLKDPSYQEITPTQPGMHPGMSGVMSGMSGIQTGITHQDPFIRDDNKEVRNERSFDEEPPILSGIIASGKNRFATFMLSSGREVEATVGDSLPGGITVVSIGQNKATLKKKSGKIFDVIRSTGYETSRPSSSVAPALNSIAPPSLTGFPQ